MKVMTESGDLIMMVMKHPDLVTTKYMPDIDNQYQGKPVTSDKQNVQIKNIQIKVKINASAISTKSKITGKL